MILAGHLWSYIREPEKLLEKLHRGLTKGGMKPYEERKQAFTARMERLFSGEFGSVSRTTFHNSLRIGHSEELLQYLYDVDGELEMRIKSREQEVRKYLQELIRQGQTPEIGTTAHCYCCVKFQKSERISAQQYLQ